MAHPVICPEEILSRLTRRYKQTRIMQLAVYDRMHESRGDSASYRVLSRDEYSTLQRCTGYDFTRYEIVASVGGPGTTGRDTRLLRQQVDHKQEID
jgi:hypothetical protein